MAPGMIGQFNIAQGSTSQLGSSPLSNFPDVETAVPQDPYMHLLEMMHAMRVELAELRAAQATVASGNPFGATALPGVTPAPTRAMWKPGNAHQSMPRDFCALSTRATRWTSRTSIRRMSFLQANAAATRQLGVTGASSC